MLPTEYVVEAGHRLVLVLGPSSSQFSVARPAQVTITTDDHSGLVLPVLEDAGETPAPISVLGFEAFRTRTA